MAEPMAAMAPRDDTLGIGNLTLRFAAWGSPADSGRAVLMLHGLTANSRTFVHLGPALAARGHYVFAPDLRGRGLSAKPPHGYGIPFHANDALSLCDRLGIEQVDIVGHSLGAQIGMYLTALHPNRVRRLVMIDAGGKIPDDTMQAIAPAVNRLGEVYPSLDAFMAQMRQNPALADHWSAFWEQYFRYDADVHADGTVSSRVPREAIIEESATNALICTEDAPQYVRRPTLVFRAAVGLLGADRGFILTADEAERMRNVMPDCRVVDIPDTNHYTIIEAPALREAVVSFLNAE